MEPRWKDLKARQVLVAWREKSGREAKAVAEEIGLDVTTYSRIENGIRRPPEKYWKAIEGLTGGRVKARMWIP